MLEIFYQGFIVDEGYKDFLIGLRNTALIAVFGLLIGFIIGALIATLKIAPTKNKFVIVLQKLSDVYVAIFRGMPMVVQLLLIHYVLFPLMGIFIDPLIEGIIAFGLNSGAYVSEIMRAGISSVDKGQMEAGRSMGLTFGATMLRIVLPQAIKNIVPTLGNEFIALVKETSVASFVTVMDIYKVFMTMAESSYEYIVPYVALAIVYIILVIVVTIIVRLIERRFAKNERK